MPNWCNNNIEIIGPKAKVDKLIEGAKKGEFINTLYPMPKALEDTQNTSDDEVMKKQPVVDGHNNCLLYTSPSPRDQRGSRMPSSA